jgi:uncharacterized repeat protein (TIGR03803 family)
MKSKKRSIGLSAVLAVTSLAFQATSTRAVAQITEQVLYGGFDNTSPDAFEPAGGVIFDGPSHLIGTTLQGGKYGGGTVFELTQKANGSWGYAMIYSFKGGTADGDGPSTGVILGHANNLYGTTANGGANGYGIVFQLTPPTKTVPHWTEKILHSFGAPTDDGQFPAGSLTLGLNGTLYGTTLQGGANTNCQNGSGGSSACGTVFELKLAKSGKWEYATIYSFGLSAITDDGQNPVGVTYYNGNLYGATEQGGSNGEGTVFELNPPPAGSSFGTQWTEPGTAPLHNFAGYPTDGAVPYVGLSVDTSGNLWGTTSEGGVNLNSGTVFELTQASGVWTYALSYSLSGTDGIIPSGVTFDDFGNLWFTVGVGDGGQGGAIALATSTTGWIPGYNWIFGGTGDGAYPSSGLTLDTFGNLYGTTQEGGTNGWGAVYEITPLN